MLINGTPMTLTRPYACCMSSRIRVEIACSSQRGVKNKSRAVIFVMGKAQQKCETGVIKLPILRVANHPHSFDFIYYMLFVCVSEYIE